MVAQIGLFQKQKLGKAILRQKFEIKEPTPDSSVMSTLGAYYTYLKSGNYSSYTADDFVGDVKKLALYLRDKKLSKISLIDLQDWIKTLKSPSGENLTAKTVSRKITAIKNYFLWLVQSGVLKENPAERLINHRVTSPLPDILFDEECDRLLKEASKDSRTYLLVLLLLETGIKKAELFNLEITHFDFSNKYKPEVWIRHKGKQVKKDRKLKLPPEIVPVFEEHIAYYHTFAQTEGISIVSCKQRAFLIGSPKHNWCIRASITSRQKFALDLGTMRWRNDSNHRLGSFANKRSSFWRGDDCLTIRSV